MKIGDEVKLRGVIVDIDSNPHGSAIKVRIAGFMDQDEIRRLSAKGSRMMEGRQVTFVDVWIHRLDQPQVLISDAKPQTDNQPQA